MPMSPGGRFGWEEAAKVKVLVSCAHCIISYLTHIIPNYILIHKIYATSGESKSSPPTKRTGLVFIRFFVGCWPSLA
jgi:hypothetical protein